MLATRHEREHVKSGVFARAGGTSPRSLLHSDPICMWMCTPPQSWRPHAAGVRGMDMCHVLLQKMEQTKPQRGQSHMRTHSPATQKLSIHMCMTTQTLWRPKFAAVPQPSWPQPKDDRCLRASMAVCVGLDLAV